MWVFYYCWLYFLMVFQNTVLAVWERYQPDCWTDAGTQAEHRIDEEIVISRQVVRNSKTVDNSPWEDNWVIVSGRMTFQWANVARLCSNLPVFIPFGCLCFCMAISRSRWPIIVWIFRTKVSLTSYGSVKDLFISPPFECRCQLLNSVTLVSEKIREF